jgi:exopolyphosphatase / guanosine-5'-triphosphate,3'-diphosphate pyrophosphatase
MAYFPALKVQPTMKKAVIDLGTNTFHLLLIEQTVNNDSATVLFRESRPAKIGKGGINEGRITPEGIARALNVLSYFREVLDQHGIAPETVQVIGTSAIRVAQNQTEFIDRVRAETGLMVRVISGDEEAELIYRGVRAAGALDEQIFGTPTALIADIGGGSVEFIIGTKDRIFWKQSFEIGGQRLLERFGQTDPISPSAVSRLNDFFQEQLLDLTNAVHQYAPTVLVGSSGTFDTLVDMAVMHETDQWPNPDQTTFSLPITEFYRIFEQFLTRNRTERLALPGMIELRVDMIVVACCLIDYLLKTFGIQEIRTSTFSLKEGTLQ